MLSQQEYDDTVWKLNNVPSSLTGKPRQDFRQMLKKKLKEHKYASMYPPFEPFPYFIYHLNYSTSTDTLNQIVQMAATSEIFILDTESVNVYQTTNKPVLIQIQILFPHNLSAVLIFEMCNLPPDHSFQFHLMKTFFQKLLDNTKTIYIWDAVVFQLNEWLDKRQSRSSFDIGLDTNIFHMNELEKQYRNQLTRYAVDDCLSMQRILINLNLIKPNHIIQATTISHVQLSGIEIRYQSSDEDESPPTQPISSQSNRIVLIDESSSEPIARNIKTKPK
ncbi:unnamed protein product [Rotaria sp. Silwood2]|nr:unnamed protein product [Rotaria sp. Silwood2]CAF4486895.1 unnamed protein product [Rotaria sp. Silwood2]